MRVPQIESQALTLAHCGLVLFVLNMYDLSQVSPPQWAMKGLYGRRYFTLGESSDIGQEVGLFV